MVKKICTDGANISTQPRSALVTGLLCPVILPSVLNVFHSFQPFTKEFSVYTYNPHTNNQCSHYIYRFVCLYIAICIYLYV